MDLNRAFAIRLTNLLNEKNISKYRLEKETGLSHSALRFIFNEVNHDIKLSTVAKVCNFFNISLVEFFDSDIFNLENIDL